MYDNESFEFDALNNIFSLFICFRYHETVAVLNYLFDFLRFLYTDGYGKLQLFPVLLKLHLIETILVKYCRQYYTSVLRGFQIYYLFYIFFLQLVNKCTRNYGFSLKRIYVFQTNTCVQRYPSTYFVDKLHIYFSA